MSFIFIAPFFTTLELILMVTSYGDKKIEEYDKIVMADIADYR